MSARSFATSSVRAATRSVRGDGVEAYSRGCAANSTADACADSPDAASAAAVHKAHETLRFKIVQRAANFMFFQLQCRVTIRFLIAGIGKRIERERVILGRGDLFFDECAENPCFDGRETELHVRNDIESD